MPKPLDIRRLAQFEPKARAKTVADTTPRDNPPPKSEASAEASSVQRWPSREAPQQTQISIKGPIETIERFKKICRDDRRAYADMLGILMDQFEQKG